MLRTTAENIPAGFIYPPPLAFFLRPLLYIDFKSALALWLLFNCFLMLACLAICVKLFLPKENRVLAIGVASVVVLASMPTRENLLLGQINYVTLFLCLMALLAVEQKRPISGGIILAVAAWIKLTPAFLLIYFLYHKRSWPVLWGFLLASFVIGGWTIYLIGVQESLRYATLILPVAGQSQLAIANKSFLAMIERLFNSNPVMEPVIAIPWLRLPLKGILVATLLSFVYRLRIREINDPHRDPQKSDRFLFAVTLLLMLLCQPMLEIHHLVFTFPALIFVIGYFPRDGRVLAGLVMTIIAVMINSRGWDAFAWHAHWSSVFLISPEVWGILFFAVFLFFMRRPQRWQAERGAELRGGGGC